MQQNTKEKSLKVNRLSSAEQEEKKEEFGTRSISPPQLDLGATTPGEEETAIKKEQKGNRFADSDEDSGTSGSTPNTGGSSPFKLNKPSDNSNQTVQAKKKEESSNSDGTADDSVQSSSGDTGKSTPYQLKASKSAAHSISYKQKQPQFKLNTSQSITKLPEDVRGKMEHAFEYDFSKVTIHKNSVEAVELGAYAFARGDELHFAPGQYDPFSLTGQELIGHELTHVIQQSSGEVAPTTEVDGQAVNDDSGLEKEADEMGAKAARGEIVGSKGEGAPSGTPVVQGNFVVQRNQVESAEPAPSAEDQHYEGLADVVPVATGAPPPPEPSPPLPKVEKPKLPKKEEKPKEKKIFEAKEKLKAKKKEAAGKDNQKKSALGNASVSADGSVTLPPLPGTGTPKTAEDDLLFQNESTFIKDKADEQKDHEPTEKKVDDAQSAAKPPDNEKQSLAEELHVEDMDYAETKDYEAYEFKTQLRARVEALTPKNLEEVQNFKKNGKADQLNEAVAADVTAEKEKAGEALITAHEAEPDLGKVEGKEVTPMPEPDPDPELGTIDPKNAAPKKKDETIVETPIQQDSETLDEQLATAEVTEEQLTDSNEPEFLAALDSKKQAQASAEATPGQFREAEEGILDAAQTDSETLSKDGLTSFLETRVEQFEAVSDNQNESTKEDERARQEVADHINSIFETTQSSVTTILETMSSTVETMFQTAADEASSAFETYVDEKMSAYKSQRYGGWTGGAKWLKDKLFGMPEEVNRFYEDGRNQYLEDMDIAIDAIAVYVGEQMANAKTAIFEGRQSVTEYVDSLEGDLKEIGEQCAEEVNDRFDQLEQDVEDSRDQLVDTIAQSYTDNLQQLDTRIEELQAANRGLVDKAIDGIKSVIQTINRLKDLLLSVINGAAGVIGEIIKHPIKFLRNLVQGVKDGFMNFVDNIQTHLQGGITGWLMGTMSEMGVSPPTSLDLKGIIGFAGDLMGMSWDFVKGKVVAVIGEKNMERVEAGVDIIVKLKNEGIGGVIDEAREQFSDIKTTIMDSIKSFLVERVFKAGVVWILSLFNPASAFVKACMMIYDVVMFFINKAQQISELIQSVISSLAAIASGNVAALAAAIENTMARFLPVAIGFLASLLGLGGISKKVREIMTKIRGKIENAIDWVVEQIRAMAEKLGLLKKKGEEDEEDDERTKGQKQADLDAAFVEVNALDNDSKTTKKILDNELPKIKSKYRLKKLTVSSIGNDGEYKVRGEVNPVKEDKITISEGNEELTKKLISLGIKKEDADKIVKSELGNTIKNYLLGGRFDSMNGYPKLLLQLKQASSIPSVLQALNKGKQLLDHPSISKIAFEDKKDSFPSYDIDVATVNFDGSYSSAYQLKTAESINSLRSSIFKAKSQIKNAPAKKKWVEVIVSSGTKSDFLEYKKDDLMLPDSIKKFWPPEISLRVTFSDGGKWILNG